MRFGHLTQMIERGNMIAQERYKQLWRELQLCDELGFDFGFTAEQHFSQMMPSPAVYCTGGSACTKRIRLGPMGYVVPFHEPIHIAEEAAILDNVLDGRLELGLVPGIIPSHFRMVGADWENRNVLTREAMLLVKAVFGTEGPVTFDGPIHQYHECRLAVRPVQKPHPPIWIMSREPDTLRFLAEEGVNTGFLFIMPRHEVAPRYREYLRLWQESGHPNRPNIAYANNIYVDETDEIAVAKAAPHILRTVGAVYGENLVGEGKDLADIYEDRGESGAAEISRNLNNFDYLLEKNLVFVGSPETVIRRVKAAAEEGFFNTLLGEFNIGSIAEEDLMRSIRLFGTHVIPALREFDPTLSLVSV